MSGGLNFVQLEARKADNLYLMMVFLNHTEMQIFADLLMHVTRIVAC